MATFVSSTKAQPLSAGSEFRSEYISTPKALSNRNFGKQKTDDGPLFLE